MCDSNGKPTCGEKGKYCKAFLTVCGKNEPDAPKSQNEQQAPRKCCGGCKKNPDQPKQG